MKILITGINSALGLSVANNLTARKNEIFGLGLSKNKYFKTFIFDLGSDKELRIPKVDVCIHFAFITDNKFCEKNKKRAYKVNILGTKKVLEYCKNNGIKKFILISTGGVYGFSNKKLNENMRANPPNSYTYMKYKAEILAQKYSKYFDVVILRYFFPYGPGANGSFLVNRLISNMIKNREIYLNKNGKPRINPIYIEDLSNATCLFMNKKFKGTCIFNIAGNEIISIKELCLEIASLLGVKPKFSKTSSDINDMIADISKLNKFYKPRTTLREGLKMTIEFIEHNETEK